MGQATSGTWNRYASICQAIDTSSGSRVRRAGTMPISASEYALRPVLPRPISTSVTGFRPCQAGRGDLDEPGLLQVGDGPCAAVAHGRAQPADELAGHRGQRAAVGHLPLDALRHQLVLAQHVILEVAVLGVGLPALPVAHGAERAHAPVELVLLAVDEDHLARALLAPGEQAPQHDGVRARGDGLGDVARVL